MSTVLDFVPDCRFGLILERVDRWIYKKNICVSVHVHVYKRKWPLHAPHGDFPPRPNYIYAGLMGVT